ncbi:NAD(P)-binding protein [Providencia huaxiensis]
MALPIGLDALEAQVKQDLQYLNLPISSWSLSGNNKHKTQVDVAIIGAGMSGITAAFALKLQGIEAIVFDQAPIRKEGYGKHLR